MYPPPSSSCVHVKGQAHCTRGLASVVGPLGTQRGRNSGELESAAAASTLCTKPSRGRSEDALLPQTGLGVPARPSRRLLVCRPLTAAEIYVQYCAEGKGRKEMSDSFVPNKSKVTFKIKPLSIKALRVHKFLLNLVFQATKGWKRLLRSAVNVYLYI